MSNSNHAEPTASDVEIEATPAQAPEHQLVAGDTGTDQPDLRRLEDHGHWEDDTFVFNRPVEMGGNIIKRLQTKGMVLEPGVTRDDVISALLNPAAVEVQEA